MKVHDSLRSAEEFRSKPQGTLRTNPGFRDLHQARKADVPLLKLPNVSVKATKVSIRNKENAIGRGKVIARELQRRGLDQESLEAKGIYLREFDGYSDRSSLRA